ncbi:hypothetical protein AVEN_252840-1 [Araneus ventricosus]|uniref:Uncharacterized protein n=1 Tax=Araneus ventricosus TaxID=182803 RepID=A0A4Y2CKN0_ARAVE|nr:hypothetical protein AVEN_252840-1 [Araneus ventricosus]
MDYREDVVRVTKDGLPRSDRSETRRQCEDPMRIGVMRSKSKDLHLRYPFGVMGQKTEMRPGRENSEVDNKMSACVNTYKYYVYEIKQESLRAFEEPIQTQQRLQQQRIRQNNLRGFEEPEQIRQRLQQKHIRQEILRTSELPD